MYLAKINIIKSNKNGNGRRLITLYQIACYDSTNTRGYKVERAEMIPKCRIFGYTTDCEEIANTLQATGTTLLHDDATLNSVPKSYLPTAKAGDIGRKFLNHKGDYKAHEIIAAI